MAGTVYDIRLNSRQFESKLSMLDRKVGKFEKRLKGMRFSGGVGANNARTKSGGGFLGLSSGAIIGGAAIAGVGLLTKKIVSLGMEAENARLTLSKLLGSKEAGESAFRETQRFAAFTPFNFRDVLKARIGLGARGVDAENQLPLLQTLGNFASVLGTETLPFLTKAVGDVLAAGKLRGQEINQFANAGINIRKMVADLKGVSVSELEGMFISAKDVVMALEKGQAKGTKFFNSMADAAKTTSGRFETLKDTLQIVAADIGNKMLPDIGEMMTMLNSGLETLGSLNLGNTGSAFSLLIKQASQFVGILAGGEQGHFSIVAAFFDTITIAAVRSAQAMANLNLAFQAVKGLVSGDMTLGKFNQIQNDFYKTDKRLTEIYDSVFERGFGNIGMMPEALKKQKVGGINFETLFGESSKAGATNTTSTGTSVSSTISGGTRGGGAITVNIENLIGKQTVTGSGTAEQIKDQVTRALQQVFTEVRIATG